MPQGLGGPSGRGHCLGGEGPLAKAKGGAGGSSPLAKGLSHGTARGALVFPQVVSPALGFGALDTDGGLSPGEADATRCSATWALDTALVLTPGSGRKVSQVPG